LNSLDGFVVAIANGGLGFSTLIDDFGIVVISLNRNSTQIDNNHELRVVSPIQPSQFLIVPVSIQRVDPCQQGASPTYRFLGLQGVGASDSFMEQPSLILMFFRDRL
jgi:hypothetical protein